MPRKRLVTVIVDESKCTGCGLCATACPVGAIILDGVAKIDRGLCAGCGICIDECPNEALYAEGSDRTESSLRPLSITPPPSNPVGIEPGQRLLPPMAGQGAGFQRSQRESLAERIAGLFTQRASPCQGRGMGNTSRCGRGQGRGRGGGGGRRGGGRRP